MACNCDRCWQERIEQKLDIALGEILTLKGNLGKLAQQEETDMTQISDAITALNASLDAALARVQEDVAALQAEIARLEALVAAGTATQADLDALAAAQAKLDALDPLKPATLPQQAQATSVPKSASHA